MKFQTLLFALIVVGLTACGVRAPTSGVEAGLAVKHSRVLLIPLLSDDLRVIWGDPWKTVDSTHAAVGWKIPDTASEIVAELLQAHGAYTIRADFTHTEAAVPKGNDEQEREIWKMLRSTALAENADAILVIAQDKVDAFGRRYSPVPDFIGLGLFGLVYGAAKREEHFSPAMTLAVMAGGNRTMLGPTRCSIGFGARLIDTETEHVIGRADMVLGQELLPDDRIQAQSWSEMTAAEKSLARDYCLAALRRGISQALVEVGLLE